MNGVFRDLKNHIIIQLVNLDSLVLIYNGYVWMMD